MKINIWTEKIFGDNTEGDTIKFKIDPEKDNPDNMETLMQAVKMMNQISFEITRAYLECLEVRAKELLKMKVN